MRIIDAIACGSLGTHACMHACACAMSTGAGDDGRPPPPPLHINVGDAMRMDGMRDGWQRPASARAVATRAPACPAFIGWLMAHASHRHRSLTRARAPVADAPRAQYNRACGWTWNCVGGSRRNGGCVRFFFCLSPLASLSRRTTGYTVAQHIV